MNYWSAFSSFNKEIISEFNRLSDSKVVLVDGGAAGSLSPPFDRARSAILAVRFEPRGSSEVRKGEDEIFIDGGLWSTDGTGTLHVASSPGSSSVLKPNIEWLTRFQPNQGPLPRETVRRVDVPMRSIDSCVQAGQMPLPNFIKLDVHSSEMPALLGANQSLGECIGLLVETWNTEVHVGQSLHHEVEKYAVENGFAVFDVICAARWHEVFEGATASGERGRYIGSEILLLREDVPNHLVLKQALIMSLFGFFSSAQATLRNSSPAGAESLVVLLEKAKRRASSFSVARRVTRKLRGLS